MTLYKELSESASVIFVYLRRRKIDGMNYCEKYMFVSGHKTKLKVRQVFTIYYFPEYHFNVFCGFNNDEL